MRAEPPCSRAKGRLGPSPEDWTWAKLSEASFAQDWNNEKDAAYDNWRELYQVAPSPKRKP